MKFDWFPEVLEEIASEMGTEQISTETGSNICVMSVTI